MSSTHGSEEDLGEPPYGKEGFAWSAFWIGLAIVAIGAAIAWSFWLYDVTHGDPVTGYVAILVLVVTAVICAIQFVKNMGSDPTASKKFAAVMLAVTVVCAVLIFIILPTAV